MAFTPTQLKYFADYIEKHLGIVYSDSNFYQLEIRLNQIVKNMGLENDAALWEKAKDYIDSKLSALLLDTATNNETSFFRDKTLFQSVPTSLLPKLKELRPDAKILRFWSAACSTGQEPYSLAILIRDFQKTHLYPEVEILATDYSERVLEKSASGVYTQLEVQRGMPTPTLVTYFDQNADSSWVAKNELRSMIKFKQLNLLSDWIGLGIFDLVLCRNVLIYQNVENRKRIIAKIVDHLVDGGILILGAAESMMGLSDQFDQINLGGAVVYQKKKR